MENGDPLYLWIVTGTNIRSPHVHEVVSDPGGPAQLKFTIIIIRLLRIKFYR